ncbi:MAG: DUF1553 domain-containing protein [Planctomycetes bacterium]|nr:DUF1553 domain-containing protein [Planctomycetota bacterium]
MRRYTVLLFIFILSLDVLGAESDAVLPYDHETIAGFISKGPIDTCVLDVLRQHKIAPANLCSDGVFVRRIFLDVIGTLPKLQESRNFLRDGNLGRRSALINALLEREEFTDYWAMKWCDVLRVKSEYPINLWPNAVQAYHRWVYDSIRENKPYDQFVRELLTSSGSNFRVPQVNFYRAIQGRKPSDIANAAALTFMGVRTQNLPAARRAELEVFFSRVAYKSTAEWKEEIVYLDPNPVEPRQGVFPDGKTVKISPQDDPRQLFADWLITPENPWFARAVVNRIWCWLMGRGIIHEPDDIRPDNPAVNPKLLDYLAKELIQSHYDLKHIYRIILNSSTYQQSSIIRSSNPNVEALFGCYLVRQLDAEVLIDALCAITGSKEEYTSAIPEPFTFIPEDQRAIELADGSITSPFLEMFGRPVRDTGEVSERNSRPTDVQRLYMLNSSDVRNKIARSPFLQKIMEDNRGNRDEIISNVYLTILSRYPTPAEVEIVKKYFMGKKQMPRKFIEDLAWALINSKEFLYRH